MYPIIFPSNVCQSNILQFIEQTGSLVVTMVEYVIYQEIGGLCEVLGVISITLHEVFMYLFDHITIARVI